MRRWVAVVPAIAGLMFMTASPASARPAVTVDPVARAAAEAAIKVRLADLNARVTLVNESPALSTGDRSTLLGELNSTIAGLTSLDATIMGETVPTAFRSEVDGIYANFRVYALVLPQVHLVRATDEITAVVVPALQKLEQALQSRITTERQQGKDVSATVSPMNDLAQQIATIGTDTTGLSASLLGLSPAQWNANHGVLSGPRQKLGAARTAAGQALTDIRTVRAVIQ